MSVEDVRRADEIELDGARRAYAAGFGATEWASFLSADEWDELQALRPHAFYRTVPPASDPRPDPRTHPEHWTE